MSNLLTQIVVDFPRNPATLIVHQAEKVSRQSRRLATGISLLSIIAFANERGGFCAFTRWGFRFLGRARATSSRSSLPINKDNTTGRRNSGKLHGATPLICYLRNSSYCYRADWADWGQTGLAG